MPGELGEWGRDDRVGDVQPDPELAELDLERSPCKFDGFVTFSTLQIQNNHF